MRKTLVAKLALAGTVGLVAAMASGDAQANCASCHTMHNSQNGSSMRFDTGATPLPILLRGTCISCHTGFNTQTTMANDDPPAVIASSVPLSGVLPAAGSGQHLAGGDFFWVGTQDAYGHNVKGGPGGLDGALDNVPPGNNGKFIRGLAEAQLECAGQYGCHGDTGVLDPLVSLSGAHHSKHNVQGDTLTLADVGTSYRFLNGINGNEDSNWQHDATEAARNVYRGAARTTNADATTGTISSLCAQCHGSYHVDAATGAENDGFGINESNAAFAAGSWLRHPTDYAMETGNEFASYTSYSFITPVASTTSNVTVAATNDRVVMCLSCHYAHGYKYPDMLRFDYTLQNVLSGRTDGCLKCHRAKS